MTRDELRDAINRITTYRGADLGGEGTCGYLLTAAQVDLILEAAGDYAAALRGEACEDCGAEPAAPCGAPAGERCVYAK